MSDTFCKSYRELTTAEKKHIEKIKNVAENLESLIKAIQCNDGRIDSAVLAALHKALALTNLEQAVMWAVKAAT